MVWHSLWDPLTLQNNKGEVLQESHTAFTQEAIFFLSLFIFLRKDNVKIAERHV